MIDIRDCWKSDPLWDSIKSYCWLQNVILGATPDKTRVLRAHVVWSDSGFVRAYIPNPDRENGRLRPIVMHNNRGRPCLVDRYYFKDHSEEVKSSALKYFSIGPDTTSHEMAVKLYKILILDILDRFGEPIQSKRICFSLERFIDVDCSMQVVCHRKWKKPLVCTLQRLGLQCDVLSNNKRSGKCRLLLAAKLDVRE